MSSAASTALATDAFAPEHLERVRRYTHGTGAYVDGEWVAGSVSASSIYAVTAPLSGQQRETLREGLRELKSRAFWIPVSEVSAITAGEADGDEITHDGDRYRIVDVKDWGAFVEALGVLPEGTTLAPPVRMGAFSSGFSRGFDIA